MSKSHGIVLCVALLAAYSVATLFNRTSAAQQAAPLKVGEERQPVLRYHLTAYGNGSGPSPTIILSDTVTGRVWIRYEQFQNAQWREIASPAQLPAEKAR
jgi:hypothetical protein